MPRKREYKRGVRIFPEFVRGEKKWRAWLGKTVTGTKPKKQLFQTEGAAKEWVDKELGFQARVVAAAEINRSEAVALELSAVQLSDARLAITTLAGRATLQDAVAAWVKYVAPAMIVPHLPEAISAVIHSRVLAGESQGHIDDLRKSLHSLFATDLFFDWPRRAMHFPPRLFIHEITKARMEKILAENMGSLRDTPCTPNQREKRLRYASILFTYAIEQGWIGKDASPIANIKPPKLITAEPSFFSALETAKLLWAIQQTNPEAVAAFAIKVFTGVRNSELFKARWEMVDDEQAIIPRAHSKTKKLRSIEVHGVLTEWLKGRRGEPHELVWSYHPKTKNRADVWYAEIKKAAKAAGITWKQNALRHGFATYLFAINRNQSRTAAEVGNDPRVTDKYYATATTKAEARIIWNLTPDIVTMLARTKWKLTPAVREAISEGGWQGKASTKPDAPEEDEEEAISSSHRHPGKLTP